jgi:predicted naringenin-chalcone synthase
MTLALLGLGTALPETVVTPDEALRLARSLCCRSPEDETWLPALYAHCGVATRHSALGRGVVDDVLNDTRHSGSVYLPTGAPDDAGPTTGERMRVYAECAPPLAGRAAAEALAEARLRPAEVTHLVTVSCTGFFAPGVDGALIRDLGLPPTVARTHVGFMGCHGALNGLRVAHAFAGSQPGARVLLVAVELASLHYHYGWDPQRVVANALFSDGAAAAVGAAGGPDGAWRLAATGSCVFADSADAMTWTVGDHGFAMTLSKAVPGLIARHLRPWLEDWLSGHGLTIEGVGSWAVHPGGPRILTAVAQGLALPAEALVASREVLRDGGNMSSPTVLFILRRLRDGGGPRPAVALAFGPGLVAEAALFR